MNVMRAFLLVLVVLLTACERPPMNSVQHGYRGTGMVQVYNPRTLVEVAEAGGYPARRPRRDLRALTRRAG